MAGWFLRCWWIQSPGAWFLVSVTRPPSFLRGSKDGNGESETEKRGLQALSCTGPRAFVFTPQPNSRFPAFSGHHISITWPPKNVKRRKIVR
ncbi:hypothetical protein BJV77DRAFT_1045302 [Russula vinacea]|nr:hypothetical protein BJV77DRAFT_1045302 [Russula vinacea]